MANPPWGLYILTAAYLVFSASVQAASNSFDGAQPDPPQQSFSVPVASLLQTQSVRCDAHASARCCRDRAAFTALY